MAVCDCGKEVSRFKTTFDKHGNASTVCRECHPEEFDRWVDPSNTHGGFRWQYEPQKYKKRELKDGEIFYEATDERNADLEASLLKPGRMEEQAAKAAEEKRKHRRTKALSKSEVELMATRAANRLREARLRAQFGI